MLLPTSLSFDLPGPISPMGAREPGTVVPQDDIARFGWGVMEEGAIVAYSRAATTQCLSLKLVNKNVPSSIPIRASQQLI